jgi:hypothetical protein
VVRSFLILSVLMLATVTTDAAAQRAADASSVSVSAKVGGKSYKGAGAGSCRHEAQASIYGAPAALWMVEYTGAGDSELERANMTLWRPKDGKPEQLSLTLRTGSSSHRITVGGRGEQVGSGKASLSADGPGGRFEIKGKDAEGKTIETVIQCPAFAGVQAEGG